MSYFSAQLDVVNAAMPMRIVGQVRGLAGLTIEAADLPLPVGSLCRITSFGGKQAVAEVIGFQQERTLLMPLSPVSGVANGDRIENIAASPRIGCSIQMLGRVLNGFGEPIDSLPPLPPGEPRRIDGKSVAPLSRVRIDAPIATGVRSIDALHTCGLGQRMGIFSGPGVGKSTLLASIARFTSAEVCVIALIGERGREVQDFMVHTLGAEAMKRCVIVASTGDEPPLLRVRAAKMATTIAEYFRDRGKNVLLLMDSLTRLCQAQRQIGLAAREPPATKGFPPSVFALLPELLERAGKTASGSVTGFYTVLVEGDDFNEPIPDAVKGISDGHLWLNRALANRGHFPAVDMLQSISRVRGDVASKEQVAQARRVLSLMAIYSDIEDLVSIGAHVPRVNLEHDLAIQTRDKVLYFLKQDAAEHCTLEQSRKQLSELIAWIDSTDKALRAQAAKAAPKAGKGS